MAGATHLARRCGRTQWRRESGRPPPTRVTLTPDGKQVIYITSESGTQSPWIRSLDGGSPRQLANVFAILSGASRDGKSLAFVSVNEKNQAVISICALPDCSSRRTFADGAQPDGAAMDS